MKAAAIALVIFASPCSAEQLHGTVISITDGDTVIVLDQAKAQHKIRLAGIDAPERHQAFGNESRQHLAAQVFQKAASDRRDYAAAEVAARKALRGLWADSSPVPPWEWRKAQKRKSAAGG